MSARVLATDPVTREVFVLERNRAGAHYVLRRWGKSGLESCVFPLGALLAYCLVSLDTDGWRWSARPHEIAATVLAALSLDELADLLETPDTRVRGAVMFELAGRQ